MVSKLELLILKKVPIQYYADRCSSSTTVRVMDPDLIRSVDPDSECGIRSKQAKCYPKGEKIKKFPVLSSVLELGRLFIDFF